MSAFVPAFIGGVLIGISAALLLWTHGRIAGVSGIVGCMLAGPLVPGQGWRIAFTLGLIGAGAVGAWLAPELFAARLTRAHWVFAVSGVLVGFGTRLGSGCTSGHGVCGVSRLSTRSIVATVTFIAAGAITVLAYRVASAGLL